MLFNTAGFLVFFIIVLTVYWIMPKQVRYIWLLAASYFFYMQWNAKYVFLLLFYTLITYFAGLYIEKVQGEEYKGRKTCIIFCIAVCIGLLCIFKYANFGISILNKGLTMADLNMIDWTSALILPVGISFYTLQTLGYLIDVYRGDIYAEKNLLRYALFVSFFPQLVAGPIERSKNLLKQLGKPKTFSYDNLRKGLLIMLWGMFIKVVIADRAAVLVDTVYGDIDTYKGLYIFIATLLFSIQIYCDFHGYSTIARGVALTMGIHLVDNFNAPYFSRSVKEFWRRWHISLSSWFRDYVYIPLGGNQKGDIRKQMNLLIVFGISGLWHGASIAFIFWGLLNGIYQVVADMIRPLKNAVRKRWGWEARFSSNLLGTISTFLLVSFAWLFFRAGEMDISLQMIDNMLSVRNWNILLTVLYTI